MFNSNFLQFNSISELIRTLDDAPEISSRDNSSDDASDASWCDTRSYNEARECMLYGKTYDGLSTNLNDYKTNGCKEHNKRYLDVAGFTPIVPLAIQNIPTSMLNKQKAINNKIINIIYECSAPWNVKSEEIMKTTKELMRNVIRLEKDGYRVNLYVCEYNSNDNGYGYVLKLKTDREVLNIKKLCFPLVSSSFLRRIGFRIKERLFKDWIGCGYGHAIFDRKGIEKMIANTLRLKHYEVWDYEGKKFNI